MPRDPRICILVESFHPVVGGMEAQTRMLAGSLAGRGHRVTVLTLRNRTNLPATERVDGYDILRVAPGATRWTALPAVARALHGMRDGYDVLFVGGCRTFGVPAVLVGQHDHKRVVLKAENAGELSGAFFDGGLARLGLAHTSPGVRQLNAVRQRVLRRADRFVALGARLRAEYLDAGVAPERVSVIPNCTDLARFRPAALPERAALRARLGLPADAVIVCFVGRLVSWKGPIVLLDAWRRLIEEWRSASPPAGPAPLLLMLGSGGADQANCEAEARRLHERCALGESVRFLGDVPDVADHLRAADVLALPSEGDTMPLAVLEAMACGLAVVTTTVNELGELVSHGRDALVVPPRDVAALTGALRALLTRPALRSELGAHATRRAAGYGRERVTSAYAALFRELDARGPGSVDPAGPHGARDAAPARRFA